MEKSNEQIAMKVSRNSIIGNVLLSAFKLFAGIFAQSVFHRLMCGAARIKSPESFTDPGLPACMFRVNQASPLSIRP